MATSKPAPLPPGWGVQFGVLLKETTIKDMGGFADEVQYRLGAMGAVSNSHSIENFCVTAGCVIPFAYVEVDGELPHPFWDTFAVYLVAQSGRTLRGNPVMALLALISAGHWQVALDVMRVAQGRIIANSHLNVDLILIENKNITWEDYREAFAIALTDDGIYQPYHSMMQHLQQQEQAKQYRAGVRDASNQRHGRFM